MTEIVMGWPWYDRLFVGIIATVLVFSPYYILQKLDRIIQLLEQLNRRD